MLLSNTLKTMAFFCLALVTNSASAMETPRLLTLVINKSQVICEGTPGKRFWLCKGAFRGLLDFNPDHVDKDFLPLLFSSQDAKINITISHYYDERNILLGGGMSFTAADYLDLDLDKLGLLAGGLAKEVAYYLEKFVEQVSACKQNIQNIALTQRIYYQDGIFSSELAILDMRKIQNPDAKIPTALCNFSVQEQKFFKDVLIYQKGRATSPEEAQNLFRTICQNPEIPFAYTDDGCDARAHVIAHWLFEQGYRTGKIWIAGDLVNPANSNKNWDFHVAAIIHVEKGETKGILVVDPSPINGKLLTVPEWLTLHNITTKPKRIAYPLPERNHFIGEKVMCFSSHIPFLPFHYSSEEDFLESLKNAREINQMYLSYL